MPKGSHPDQAYEEERHHYRRLTAFPCPPPSSGRGGQSGKGAIKSTPVAADWQREFQALLAKVPEALAANKRDHLRIDALERQVEEFRKLVGDVQRGNFIIVPVQSLGDEPVELSHEIHVLVQPTGDDFIATYFDAGMSASGDTDQEAVDNLKAYMVDLFELLEQDEGKLGPGPRRQLAVLRTVLQRRA